VLNLIVHAAHIEAIDRKWENEWLLFGQCQVVSNCQMYHGENKLYFDEMMMIFTLN